jgi:hypothetical protein
MTAKDGNKFVNLILLLLENLLFFRAKRSVIAVVDPVVFDSADGIHGRDEVTFQFQVFGEVQLLFGLVVIEVFLGLCGRRACARTVVGPRASIRKEADRLNHEMRFTPVGMDAIDTVNRKI